MKNIVIILFTIFATAGNFIQAQSLDAIISRHIQAVGQDKVQAVKSYSIEAEINQMGNEIPMTMKMKSPDKFRMELEVQGQKMIQAFDGKHGWMIAPWISQEPQELTGQQLDQAKDQANINDPFYNYKERGYKAELVGKDTLDGKDVFNIRLVDSNGEAQSYYLDPETYYIRSEKRMVNSNGTNVEVEMKLSDYKVFNGIAMATSIESNTSMGSMTVKIKKVEFDTPLDDSIFEQPKE